MKYIRNRGSLGLLPQLPVTGALSSFLRTGRDRAVLGTLAAKSASPYANSALALTMDGVNDGTSFPDSSPNNITVTPTNVVTKTGTKYEGSASACFNGSTSLLTFPYVADFDFSSGDHAIDLYFYANALGGCLFSKSKYGSGMDLVIKLTNSTTITVIYNQYSANVAATVPEMSTETWYRLTVQLTNGCLEIYLDGTLYGEWKVTPENRCNETLAIGAANYNNPSEFFDGYIDRFTIMNELVYPYPDYYDGALVWYDVSQLTGLNDDDPVQTLTDLSGNSYSAAQPTADLRPLYKTNIINGKPVLRFDGSNDYMGLTLNKAWSTVTMLAVAAVRSTSPDIGMLVDCQSWSGYSNNWVGIRWRMYGDSNLNCGVDMAQDGTFYVLGGVIGTGAGTSGYATQNGTDTSGKTGNAGNGTYLNIAKSSTKYTAWDVAEILIWDSVLSLGRYADVKNQLATKYGITF